MLLERTLHVGLLLLSAVTTTALAVYAWNHHDQHAVRPFGGLMVGFTLYSLAHMVGLVTLDPFYRRLWEYLQWTGSAVVPVFWLVFAMEYTGHDEMLTPRTLALLGTVPAVTIALVWTNPLHGLMWTENTVVVVDGFAIMRQPFGAWGQAVTVITYGMLGVGAFLLLRLIWLSNRLYASQSLVLIVGIAAPVLANVLTVLGVSVIREPPLDLSPYAFSVTGLAFGYALFRERLFDLVPATHQLGRDAAIRDLAEGVVVVDTDRRIVYCNPAAGELLDCEPAATLGVELRDLIDDEAIDFGADGALAELRRDGEVYEVRTSPIRSRGDAPIGHTVLLQDVTERKRRTTALARQRDDLARLERLNEVIRGVNRALVAATDREGIERAVCEKLAGSELYDTACVADLPSLRTGGDWTTARDGDRTPPRAVTEVDADGDDPAVVVADGAPAWTVVPLCNGRTVYGTLAVLPADGPDGATRTLPERERSVLVELGEIVGRAIRAVEDRRLLAAESVVELELESTDTAGALLGAAERAGTALSVTGVVPDAGTNHLGYVRVEDDPASAAAAFEGGGGDGARVVRDDGDDVDGGLVEWPIPPGSPLGILVEHGAKVRHAVAEDGVATFVVELASDADVRSVVERVAADYPATDVETIREHDRPVVRADTVPDAVVDELTDRQREVLETAYRAGYYDWPRESTAEEVAETLDIAAPTLHAHLRKAHGRLLTDLFDAGPRIGDDPDE